ncbi:DNA methyltransferase [Streptomyces sp. SID8379]|uniref:type ISP restriction/modification enzyme n=1 Tax=unclassified Streptomyces TaxID=2593676 RepID=UPI00037E395A|nr:MULTISPECIES: type ISP restriction/modification enzyme [unclassified Streptomyces]MYW69679.1 DNA methyltransferase [Streptomyces sp. SID8379]
MPGVTNDRLIDAPELSDLMPWSVAPLRLGRGWPVAPDAASLKARWDTFVRGDTAEREALLEPSRGRTLHTAAAQLPGQRTGTGPLADAKGPCPEPVRILHGPFDEQWLIPDQRLIDAARPELWRVADEHQLYLVEQGYVPDAGGPVVLASAVLPEGRSPAGRPGRIRPLFRRPGGTEPNIAPGLLQHLSGTYDHEVTATDLFAWILAAAGRGTRKDCRVPLPEDPDVWLRGVELGRRVLWLERRGAGTERPKLPGGRRPYVRAPLPARPVELLYDREEEALLVGDGRISPVPAAAWDFHVGGVRVLEQWFARRAARAEPGTLAAVGPASWPQPWTSELLELVAVLALLAELRPPLDALAADIGDRITSAELTRARVLPVPDGSRRPASVLDHQEEGPGGQFAIL